MKSKILLVGIIGLVSGLLATDDAEAHGPAVVPTIINLNAAPLPGIIPALTPGTTPLPTGFPGGTTPGGGSNPPSGGGGVTPGGTATPGTTTPGGTATPGTTPGGGATPSPTTPGGRATVSGGTTPPATPSGGGGTTPSGARPGPGALPAAGGTTPRGRKNASAPGLSWEGWWVANRERFLRPRLPRVSRTQAGVVDHVEQARRDEIRLRVAIVAILREALTDSSADVRRGAAVALGKIGAPAAPAMLREALRDSDQSVRESALLAIGLLRGPRCVDQLVAVLDDTADGRQLLGLSRRRSIPASFRRHAATALGLAGRTAIEAAPRLLDLAVDNDTPATLAEASLHALGMIEANDAAPQLLELANKRSTPSLVRSTAIAALAKIGDRGALSGCVEALAHSDAAVRRSAAVSVGRLATDADKTAIHALKRTVRTDSDRATRNFAIMALGEIGSTEARDALLAILRSARGQARGFAALALGVHACEHGDDEADALAERLLKVARHDDNDRVRGAAATALGLMRRTEAVPTLIAMLEGPRQASNRLDAALALGLVGDRRGTKPVRDAMAETTDPALRILGALALGLIGDDTAVDALTEALARDGGLALSGATLVGLGRIGGAGVVDAIGKMARTTGHKQAPLRAAAARALGALGDREDVPALGAVGMHGNFADWSGGLRVVFGKL